MHGQMFPDAETAPYSSAAPVASLTSKILIRSVASFHPKRESQHYVTGCETRVVDCVSDCV